MAAPFPSNLFADKTDQRPWPPRLALEDGALARPIHPSRIFFRQKPLPRRRPDCAQIMKIVRVRLIGLEGLSTKSKPFQRQNLKAAE